MSCPVLLDAELPDYARSVANDGPLSLSPAQLRLGDKTTPNGPTGQVVAVVGDSTLPSLHSLSSLEAAPQGSQVVGAES